MSDKLHLMLGLIMMFAGIALIWWNPEPLIISHLRPIPLSMVICGAAISGITIYRMRKGYAK